MLMVAKEIRINNMIASDHCIRHFKTIRTKDHIYMIQEYANCFDLQCLIDQRTSLQQEEARIVVRQIAKGVNHLASLNILHRDLKPANIMLHFPDIPHFERLSSSEKLLFLKNVDLKETNFQVKIADFGLSTVLDPQSSVLSIVGTPLYQAP